MARLAYDDMFRLVSTSAGQAFSTVSVRNTEVLDGIFIFMYIL